MLSLQTSNDDLCWLVGLCPRSRTASSIQGQSVLGRDGGSPAAPAVWPCRGLLRRCHTPGNKGDRRPGKDSDTSHTATWDHPSCCSAVLVSHADGLKGELHKAALRGSPHNHGQLFYLLGSGTAPFIPEKLYLFVPCWFLALRIKFILPACFSPYFSTPSFPGGLYTKTSFASSLLILHICQFSSQD